MTRDVNITSQEWCELIFEGKNQKYGAFYLRKTSSNRHLLALLITVSATATLICAPLILNKLKPAAVDNTDISTGTVTMVTVEPDKPLDKLQVVTPPPPVNAAATLKYIPPVISKDAPDENDMLTQDAINRDKKVLIYSTKQEAIGDGTADMRDLDANRVNEIIAPPPVTKKEILVGAEIMPMFPGGMDELRKFLGANLRYPQIAVENGIFGRVTVRFAVFETGKIGSVEVIGRVDPCLDEEAVRLVKAMPNWIPGKQNGKNVAVYFVLPVVFALDN